jgi:hypothetical protein
VVVDRRGEARVSQLLVLAAIIFAVYLAIRLVATAGAWFSGSRFRAYRALAARFQGKYENRGISDPPTVSFTYNGSQVRVGLAPQLPGHARDPRTRVVARFPGGLPFRLELAPTSRPSPTQAPKGTRPVRVGDKEFDRSYVVQSNDPEMAAEFLCPAVRWSIANLNRLAPPSGFLLSVNPERLLVQVDRDLGLNAEALGYAVNEALFVHNGLRRAVAARLDQGVSIIEVGATKDETVGPPICRVCGEPIVSPEVVCKTCRTPHHRDCWEFVGNCSIYGCNGRQMIPA